MYQLTRPRTRPPTTRTREDRRGITAKNILTPTHPSKHNTTVSPKTHRNMQQTDTLARRAKHWAWMKSQECGNENQKHQPVEGMLRSLATLLAFFHANTRQYEETGWRLLDPVTKTPLPPLFDDPFELCLFKINKDEPYTVHNTRLMFRAPRPGTWQKRTDRAPAESTSAPSTNKQKTGSKDQISVNTPGIFLTLEIHMHTGATTTTPPRGNIIYKDDSTTDAS
jgi:hypothetical protein